jgi:hypothetical protein
MDTEANGSEHSPSVITTFLCMQFACASVVLKYYNLAKFSKDLLAVLLCCHPSFSS